MVRDCLLLGAPDRGPHVVCRVLKKLISIVIITNRLPCYVSNFRNHSVPCQGNRWFVIIIVIKP